MPRAAKRQLSIYLKQTTHDRLEAEADRREETLSATVDQWLRETLPPASATTPDTAPDAAPADEPLPPCPYLIYEESLDAYIWDAVAAKREGLTPARFAKKYGRSIDSGAEL